MGAPPRWFLGARDSPGPAPPRSSVVAYFNDVSAAGAIEWIWRVCAPAQRAWTSLRGPARSPLQPDASCAGNIGIPGCAIPDDGPNAPPGGHQATLSAPCGRGAAADLRAQRRLGFRRGPWSPRAAVWGMK